MCDDSWSIVYGMNKSRRIILPWSLTFLVSVLAVYVWGQSFGWRWHVLNSYLFFPVLGLLAYSIMWSHYIIGVFERTLFHGLDLTRYFRRTSYAVLIAIVLHPGILVYQLYRDGAGLPPGSYKAFVGPDREWLVLLGVVSLFVFLAFELHRWYGQKVWWKYVVSAGDLAMVAIFYHGLRLGDQLQAGWYVTVWWFYGLTLITVLAYKYLSLLQHRLAAAKLQPGKQPADK